MNLEQSMNVNENIAFVDSSIFRKKFQAIAIGNVMEFFDFAAFGAFADIIGIEFFPDDTAAMQLLKSMSIFGAAFVMRPIGTIRILPLCQFLL